MVTDALADCGDYGYTPGPSTLSAQDVGGGQVNVMHESFSVGCCPTFTVQAFLDVQAGTIDTTYNTQPDPCDCICNLDGTYAIQGVPAGTWTLQAPGDSVQVTVQ